jgi:acetyltransferase EpsM
MSRPADLVIIGGGGHASVVVEAALSRPDLWAVRGFVDPVPHATLASEFGVPHLGTDDETAALIASDTAFVLGLGATPGSLLREIVAAKFSLPDTRWARIVHARAVVASTAILGPGSVVMAGAVINPRARLGAHCIVNTAAIVEHHVTIGDFTHIAPGAAVGGGATVGSSCYVGLGARVRDHVRVGARVTVAMGAVVTRDLSDGVTVLGVPARSRPRS